MRMLYDYNIASSLCDDRGARGLPAWHGPDLWLHCRHCWVDSEAIVNGWGPKSFCPSDEHYIPTLLASKGLDNETDCTVTSHTAHPCSQSALPEPMGRYPLHP